MDLPYYPNSASMPSKTNKVDFCWPRIHEQQNSNRFLYILTYTPILLFNPDVCIPSHWRLQSKFGKRAQLCNRMDRSHFLINLLIWDADSSAAVVHAIYAAQSIVPVTSPCSCQLPCSAAFVSLERCKNGCSVDHTAHSCIYRIPVALHTLSSLHPSRDIVLYTSQL